MSQPLDIKLADISESERSTVDVTGWLPVIAGAQAQSPALLVTRGLAWSGRSRTQARVDDLEPEE
jgi:hypothetical protein